MPKLFALLTVRPEVRYDQIVAGDALFCNRNGPDSRSRHPFIFGGDVVLSF